MRTEMSGKKKESGEHPDAERWVAEENAKFEAEVLAAAQSSQNDDDKRLQRQIEAEEEEAWMHANLGDGPDYGDDEEEEEDDES